MIPTQTLLRAIGQLSRAFRYAGQEVIRHLGLACGLSHLADAELEFVGQFRAGRVLRQLFDGFTRLVEIPELGLTQGDDRLRTFAEFRCLLSGLRIADERFECRDRLSGFFQSGQGLPLGQTCLLRQGAVRKLRQQCIREFQASRRVLLLDGNASLSHQTVVGPSGLTVLLYDAIKGRRGFVKLAGAEQGVARVIGDCRGQGVRVVELYAFERFSRGRPVARRTLSEPQQVSRVDLDAGLGEQFGECRDRLGCCPCL